MKLALATVAILSIGFLVLSFSKVEAQISVNYVVKKCEQKTLVYDRDDKGKMVKVGEKIDDYCRGVLEGVFSILLHNQTICVKNEPGTPEFLLSTFLTYRTETKTQEDDAAAVIEAALKRAFRCGN